MLEQVFMDHAYRKKVVSVFVRFRAPPPDIVDDDIF
jgi:hypothetical protein